MRSQFASSNRSLPSGLWHKTMVGSEGSASRNAARGSKPPAQRSANPTSLSRPSRTLRFRNSSTPEDCTRSLSLLTEESPPNRDNQAPPSWFPNTANVGAAPAARCSMRRSPDASKPDVVLTKSPVRQIASGRCFRPRMSPFSRSEASIPSDIWMSAMWRIRKDGEPGMRILVWVKSNQYGSIWRTQNAPPANAPAEDKSSLLFIKYFLL